VRIGSTCSNLRFMVTARSEGDRFFVRSPKRVTITLPCTTFERIVSRSNQEGRSLSNLAAYLLERGVEEQ
jgi:hypothetical protein